MAWNSLLQVVRIDSIAFRNNVITWQNLLVHHSYKYMYTSLIAYMYRYITNIQLNISILAMIYNSIEILMHNKAH